MLLVARFAGRRYRYLLVAACAAAFACGEEVSAPPEPEPTFLDAAVNSVANNGLAAEVVVRATLYDSALVRYWGSDGMVWTTPMIAFGTDSSSQVLVLGMLANDQYSLEVNLLRDGAANPVDTLTFATDPLPSWIPPAVAQGTDTTPGYLAISYPDGVVTVDNLGRPVWYLHDPDALLNSFQAQDDGRYTKYRFNDTSAAFYVYDLLGRQQGKLTCAGRPTRFHDLLMQRDGDYWIMCDDSVTMDLSAFGGRDSANVIWTVLQHVSADGELLFEWNSADHVEITDIPASDRAVTRVNATHGNGIEFDTDGGLLLSLRTLNQVMKIDPTTGEVLWRLGGVRNEFTFINDPLGGFQHQHGLRRSGPGFLQLLDNRTQARSRFVRYLVNPIAKTATLVIDFRDSPTTFTPVGGATQYYKENGHAVVTFGRAGRIVEIDEFGNRAWELVGIDNTYVFRVQRIGSLYAPRRSPGGAIGN